MTCTVFALSLLAVVNLGAPAADSGDNAIGAPVPAVASETPCAPATAPTGPRLTRVAFFVRGSASLDSAGAGDTTSRRPRAIEHSDAYYTRLTIHRVASYTELPLFGAEYVLGERLLKDERTGFPPSSLKGAHLAVAGGLGVLFAVNTVTGAWNLWDSRNDPGHRTLRIVHSLAMLGADAGFAWAGAIGGNAKNSLHGAQQHRAVSVGSMALATAGTAIMWLFDK